MQRERDESRLSTLYEESSMRREHVLDQNHCGCRVPRHWLVLLISALKRYLVRGIRIIAFRAQSL
jgi:hypothetical protein